MTKPNIPLKNNAGQFSGWHGFYRHTYQNTLFGGYLSGYHGNGYLNPGDDFHSVVMLTMTQKNAQPVELCDKGSLVFMLFFW